MHDASPPLVPEDCDLRDFQFIPIDVQRLLKSETWVLGTGEEKAAAMTLWLESWHQVPAASLPNDERMLAHLSMTGSRWRRVREHVLRGWVEASDGRLYHPVVAEKALEAWMEKLANSISGASGNAKRWGVEVDVDSLKDRFRTAVDMLRTLAPQSRALKKKMVAIITSPSPPDTDPDRPPIGSRSVGDRKGQGQGQGQRQGQRQGQELTPPAPPAGGASAAPAADPPPRRTAEKQKPPDGLDLGAWNRWTAYRKEIRKPLKPASVPAAQRVMAQFGADQAAVVEQSIAQGWQGLFALKVGSAPAPVRAAIGGLAESARNWGETEPGVTYADH